MLERRILDVMAWIVTVADALSSVCLLLVICPCLCLSLFINPQPVLVKLSINLLLLAWGTLHQIVFANAGTSWAVLGSSCRGR